MKDDSSSIERFLVVVAEGQTYRNLAYLLLAFPLGVFYFCFLVTGLSLGFALLVLWVGVPILLLVMAAWWGLVSVERFLASSLLRIRIPSSVKQGRGGESIWGRFVSHIKDPLTWRGLAFLVLKFPLGLLSFIVTITLLTITLALLAAPFTYDVIDYEVWFLEIDTPSESAFCMLLGAVIGLVSMHITNAVALISGRLAAALLAGDQRD